MKRTIAVFLLLGFLFAACGKKPETEPAPDFSSGIAAENAADFTVAGGKLWILSGGEVKTAGGTGEETETLPIPDGFVPAFLASDGEDPVLCSADGQIYWDGELTTAAGEGVTVTSFAVAGDTAVCSVVGPDSPDVGRLVFLSRADGGRIERDPVYPGVCRVIPGDGEGVWILNFGVTAPSWSVYRFDTVTMQPDFPYKLNDGWDIEAAAADTDGKLWLMERMGDARTTETLAPDGTASDALRKTLPPFTGPEENTRKILFAGEYLVTLNDAGTVAVLTDYLGTGRFVTIALTPAAEKNSRSDAQMIAESLTVLAAAEGITLNVLELTEEQIAAKLLAGEGDIDLFVMEDSALALEKPYWNPLDGFQELDEVKTKLTDGAIRCSSYRGNWFGIPIFGGIGRAAWTVSEALAAEIGLTEEETVSLGMTDGTWTLRDYYALALRAKEKGIFVSRWFPLGREEYAARFFALSDTGETAGKLTDDGTYLREMLSLSKTMADEGLYDEFYTGDRVLMELGARDGILVFSPTFDGERHYPVSMRYFMMNSASERQEDAAKVLAMIADPENRFWPEVISGFRLYRDGAEEDPVFRAAEPYFTILPGLSREWMNFAGEEGWKYMNSEQDLEYTVKRIFERAKMVLEG